MVEVDHFESQESTQCPLWFSLSLPTSLGINAQPWPAMNLYAFPPVKLIPVVLCRVKTYGVHLLLVALFWPSQMWFSELVSLLEGDPWEPPFEPLESAPLRIPTLKFTLLLVLASLKCVGDLQALSVCESCTEFHLICPVRALKMYVDRSTQCRKSLQLLVCFGAGHKGLAASKHTISH